MNKVNLLTVLVCASFVSACQSVPAPNSAAYNSSKSSLATRYSQMPVSLRQYIKDENINTVTREIAARGLSSLDMGELDNASIYFNSALKLDITSSYMQFLNALTYHLQALNGDSEKFSLAEQGYKMAYKFDSSNWLAKYYLGLSYIDQRQFSKAQKELAGAALMNEQDVEILYDLAFASYYAGDAHMALGALNKVVETHPERANDPKVIRALVVANAALNRTEHSEDLMTSYKDIVADVSSVNGLNQRVSSWERFHKYTDTTELKLNKEKANNLGLENSEFTVQKAAATRTVPVIPGAAPNRRRNIESTSNSSNEADDSEMVVVDVVIIRTQEDVSSTKGLNLLSGLQVQFGDPLSSTPGVSYERLRNYDAASNSDSSAITQLVSIPSVNYSLNIFNTLSGRNEVLARPSLVALSGKTSEFFSGVDVIAAAVSGGDGTAVSINKEIGVKLAVKPEFLSDDKVRLEVEAERTFLTTPSSSVVFEFRLDTSKTTVNANVEMNFGETLVLSGLTEEESESSRDSVPFLGDIPGLQYFFSRQGTREFRRSVLILLTPRRTHYVNRSDEDNFAAEAGLSDFERTVREFENRNQNWFIPRSTISDAMQVASKNSLFNEFKTGDFELENWHKRETHGERLKKALGFLFY